MPTGPDGTGDLPTIGAGFPQEPKLYLATAMTDVLSEIVALRPPAGNVTGVPTTSTWPGNSVVQFTASFIQPPKASTESVPGPRRRKSPPTPPSTAPLLAL